MAYIRLAITKDDREKILADAAATPGKSSWFNYAGKNGIFPTTWALDREHNHYLFCMPARIREESNRPPYAAFLNGRMFRLARGGLFSSEIYFDEDALPSAAAIPALENEVRAALAVYGWNGDGDTEDLQLLGPRFVARMPVDEM